MVGLERSVLPLFAEQEFGVTSRTVVLSFLASFGLAKALSNLFAGRWSDRLGRRSILVAGWLAGLPVPFLLLTASGWQTVVLANLFLGINQGLCWSMTVVMKIDLVGQKRRGLAMGLNESAGYMAVSLSALFAGLFAAQAGLRLALFLPGLCFVLLGLGLSVIPLRETLQFTRAEAAHAQNVERRQPAAQTMPNSSFKQVFAWASWQNRSLVSLNQAGLVNNLNDAMVWGLAPILLARANLPLEQIGLITALYPGVWGAGQLFTGGLSDRFGRKGMISAGLIVQAGGILLLAATQQFWFLIGAAALLGVGTAMVYPVLIAAVSDAAQPLWRATAVGIYRLWRDSGYLVGAVFAGYLADVFSIPFSILAVGVLTFFSGMVVWRWMEA